MAVSFAHSETMVGYEQKACPYVPGEQNGGRVGDIYWHENTKGVKALGALLRQTLEVGEELTPEMLALLLRLAHAEMDRLPLPVAHRNSA